MELAIVLVIALLILGPKRLPEAGRSLGRGLREFKDSIGSAPRDEESRPVVDTSTEPVARVAN